MIAKVSMYAPDALAAARGSLHRHVSAKQVSVCGENQRMQAKW